MKIRKDTVFAVAATFCLCASIFAVIPIRSALPYDPWSDTFDENGKIDMKDIGYMASQFATSGDPTKNVTISGHANKLASSIYESVPSNALFHTPWIPLDGYSKFTVCVQTTSPNNRYRIDAKHFNGLTAFQTDIIYDFDSNLVRTYDAMNQYIMVLVVNEDTVSRDFWIDVYLIA